MPYCDFVYVAYRKGVLLRCPFEEACCQILRKALSCKAFEVNFVKLGILKSDSEVTWLAKSLDNADRKHEHT